jgi:fructose-1-phosphate kinase PfkB-like protein
MGWALVREGEERIDFFTMDPEVNLTDWTRIRKYWREVLRKGDWWVVAGSSATGWPKGWWKKLIGDLQKKGVTVLVDSRGALMREAVAAGADWIKCNLAEAEATTGMKGVERCIPNLIGNGTTGAVVTLGKEGLVAEVNGTKFSIPAPKVKVKDPTGAGDVVTASLIYGEMLNLPMEQTLKRAVEDGALHAKGKIL